ncbi:hypothetical protein [Arthrobacter castelli]|uniref:hypothetical protein n=1 Tax=Arthrobacter castelli TaxID=271431 RepID=UPI0012DC5A52|nr:hypothetical protein [Arthrobacter castelli]
MTTLRTVIVTVAAIGGITVVLIDGYSLGSTAIGATALALALAASGFRFRRQYS